MRTLTETQSSRREEMMKHALTEKSELEVVSLSPPLKALWHAAHGRWDTAHSIVQDDASTDCAWVHAYLHRVEGDLGNAQYWYHRAGKQPPMNMSLEQELEELIQAFSQ